MCLNKKIKKPLNFAYLVLYFLFQVSLADIAVYTVFDTPLMQVPTLMDSYLKLKAHRKMIEGFPKLAQYVKNRKFDII